MRKSLAKNNDGRQTSSEVKPGREGFKKVLKKVEVKTSHGKFDD